MLDHSTIPYCLHLMSFTSLAFKGLGLGSIATGDTTYLLKALINQKWNQRHRFKRVNLPFRPDPICNDTKRANRLQNVMNFGGLKFFLTFNQTFKLSVLYVNKCWSMKISKRSNYDQQWTLDNDVPVLSKSNIPKVLSTYQSLSLGSLRIFR